MKPIPEQIFDLGRGCHRGGDPSDLDITCAGCDSSDCRYCKAVKLAKALHPCPPDCDDEQEFYDYHGDDFWETMAEFQRGFDAEVSEERLAIESHRDDQSGAKGRG